LIKTSCEKIQNLGHGKDETGMNDETPEHCVAEIKIELGKLRKEYIIIEWALKKFYNDPS